MESAFIRSNYKDFLVTSNENSMSWYYVNYLQTMHVNELNEVIRTQTLRTIRKFYLKLISPGLALFFIVIMATIFNNSSFGDSMYLIFLGSLMSGLVIFMFYMMALEILPKYEHIFYQKARAKSVCNNIFIIASSAFGEMKHIKEKNFVQIESVYI